MTSILLLTLGIVVFYFIYRKKVESIIFGDRFTIKELIEILQAKGFTNTELIITEGSISPTGNILSSGLEKPTFNILIGVKDGVLSFFGGGTNCGRFRFKNDAVILNDSYNRLSTYMFSMRKDEKKYRHLFDILISDIVEISPQQKGKAVILNIYEKSDRRTRLCFHYWSLNELNIVIGNIMMGAFEKIMETGSISKGKISQINEDIYEAIKENTNLLKTKIFKGVSTCKIR